MSRIQPIKVILKNRNFNFNQFLKKINYSMKNKSKNKKRNNFKKKANNVINHRKKIF